MTVIGAGVTLHEALAAADLLKRGKEGGMHKVFRQGTDCRPGLGGEEESHLIK